MGQKHASKTASRSAQSGAPGTGVVSIIHIRRDARFRLPWVMRSCTGERRLQSLAAAIEAATYAVAASTKAGREVVVRLHGGMGHVETFTTREWQERARTKTLPVAMASLFQMLPAY